jgi:hypothetical protein
LAVPPLSSSGPAPGLVGQSTDILGIDSFRLAETRARSDDTTT